MELRFGLADGIERTQKEAADALGISQSYISRLEKTDHPYIKGPAGKRMKCKMRQITLCFVSFCGNL